MTENCIKVITLALSALLILPAALTTNHSALLVQEPRDWVYKALMWGRPTTMLEWIAVDAGRGRQRIPMYRVQNFLLYTPGKDPGQETDWTPEADSSSCEHQTRATHSIWHSHLTPETIFEHRQRSASPKNQHFLSGHLGHMITTASMGKLHPRQDCEMQIQVLVSVYLYMMHVNWFPFFFAQESNLSSHPSDFLPNCDPLYHQATCLVIINSNQ